MYERFTDEARHVVRTARADMRELAHPHIGTEHLLLALADEDSGPSHTVLAEFGITRAVVLARIRRHRGAGALDADALSAIGIDLDAVRHKVEQAFGPGALDPPPFEWRTGLFRRRTHRGPISPRARKVLELSLREALRLGHRHIGSEHILLGLIREGEGLAALILAESDVDFDALRARLVASSRRAA